MNLVLAVGLLISIGLIGGRLISRAKLPAVTGYILIGIVIGPSILGLLDHSILEELSPISDLALSLIGFTIGGKIDAPRLYKYGRSIGTIVFMQSFGALILVALVVLALGESPAVALILGSTAISTAPAGTLAVINQYRAKGPLTDTLLTIVALDDILGVLVFGSMLAFVKAFQGVPEAFPILISLAEITLSLTVGILEGLLISYLATQTRGPNELLGLVIGLILITTGATTLLADITPLNLSFLLANTAAGATVSNVGGRRVQIFNAVHQVDAPLYVAFFTLAGASLRLDILFTIGLLGAGYVIARAIGKYAGAYAAATLTHAPRVVSRYVGLGLIPQAGVAIGLAFIALEQLPAEGEVILAVTLAAVTVNEILGPIGTHFAILHAGESSE